MDAEKKLITIWIVDRFVTKIQIFGKIFAMKKFVVKNIFLYFYKIMLFQRCAQNFKKIAWIIFQLGWVYHLEFYTDLFKILGEYFKHIVLLIKQKTRNRFYKILNLINPLIQSKLLCVNFKCVDFWLELLEMKMQWNV